ncbi:MAG: hypothetical protein KKB77_11990 [Bacteroidetes bacterium]|nr:hypothetical protein [Bacteroidota bacterium]
MKRIREKVRMRQYVVTLHAEEEMDSITAEWKYLITGKTFNGRDIVIITVYVE